MGDLAEMFGLGGLFALGAWLAWDLARANLRHGHHERPPLPPLIVGDGDPRFGSMCITSEAVLHHELPSAAGYLRGLDSVFGHVTMTGVPRCSDPPEESCADAACPVHGWNDDDAPWTVIEHEPAPPPSEAEVAAARARHGYIPELDPGPEAAAPAPSPDQLTICEDWTMPTDIACRACAQVDDGWACQADLGGRCPSDPDNYVPEPDPRAEPSLGPRAGAVLAAYEQRLGARREACT